jgi:hypothetical protein
LRSSIIFSNNCFEARREKSPCSEVFSAEETMCTPSGGKDRYIALPRGLIDEVLDLFRTQSISVNVIDHRFSGVPLQVEFQGERRSRQTEAAKALASCDVGILCAPTAFGKTAVAAQLIAMRKVNGPWSAWGIADDVGLSFASKLSLASKSKVSSDHTTSFVIGFTENKKVPQPSRAWR